MDAPSRTARRPVGNRRPTVRDLVGLAAIALLQPMSSSAYQRYLGMHYDVARRSLNRLRDLGLVRAHVVAMERPRLYTLTPAGAREVARLTGGDTGEVTLLRDVAEAGLAHHEATVDVAVSLLVAASRSTGLDVAELLLDRDLRARAGNPRGAIVPDAAVSFRAREASADLMFGSAFMSEPYINPGEVGPASDHADGHAIVMDYGKSVISEDALGIAAGMTFAPPSFAVAVEADLGTENPSWFATHKALGYAVLRESGRPLLGCPGWAVLVTTPSLRRLHRLAAASVEAGAPEGLLYFAVAAEVTEDNVLGNAWRTFRPSGEDGEFRLAYERPFAAVRSGRPVRPDAPGASTGPAAPTFSVGADSADFRRGRRG